MSQQIELPATKIMITIPDDMKLVPMDSNGYEGESLTGRVWNMKDLREWCGNKDDKWIRKYILANPHYHDELEAMEHDGTLIRSTGAGSPWHFKASVMAEFLDQHWSELPW